MNITASSWTPVQFTKVTRKLTSRPLQILTHGNKLSLYWDSERNAPSVVDDICKHRGASLSNGGVIEEGCVKCKYHGHKTKPSAREAECTTTSGGVVWIESGEGQLPDDETAPPTTWELDDPTCRVSEYTRRFDGCNPVLVVENTLDWSHLDTVHLFHLVDGTPTVKIHRGGYNGKASYTYTFLQDKQLVIENEYWGPWTTCLRFIFDGEFAFTILFTIRPESATSAALLIRVARRDLKFLGPVGDMLYALINELPLMEDRYIVRHTDPQVWSKNRLTASDAFLKEYRKYMLNNHFDILNRYVQ